jgi:NAD(P)-dependent dehydrogenase (short-subunit alcohol dehydrogenase family)
VTEHVQVVVVTGAGSGIGRATALCFAQHGARLLVNDIDAGGLAETARLVGDQGAEVVSFTGDVASRAVVDDLVAQAVQRFGGLDVMVANAGVSRDRPFLETSEEDLDRTLAVNLKGVFLCGQAAARAMISARRPGHIVNIASIYGEVTAPECSAYSASKGGVRTLTRAMALELGPLGLHVNAVSPGFIETGMTADYLGDPDERARIELAVPLRRIGVPADIASVVHFLTTPEAGYVNGETIVVDGGWIAQ